MNGQGITDSGRTNGTGFMIKVLVGLSLFGAILVLFFRNWTPFLFLFGLTGVLIIIIKPQVGLYTIVISFSITEYMSFLKNYSLMGNAVTISKILGIATVGSWLLNSLVLKRRFNPGSNAAYLIIYTLTVLLSVFVAEDKQTAMSLFQSILMILLFYFLIVNLIFSEKHMRELSWVISGAGVMVFFPAVFQRRFGIGTGGAGNIPGTERFGAEAAHDPNVIGLMLVVSLFVTLGMFLGGGSRRSRIFSMMFIPLIIITIFLTVSRGAIVAVLVGFMYLAFKKLRNVGALFVLLLITALGVLFMPEYLYERIAFAASGTDPSTMGRLYAWRAGLITWVRHPLLGVGTGNFVYYARDLLPLDLRRLAAAHNAYITVLAETGILGAIPFFLVLWHSNRLLNKSLIVFERSNRPWFREVALGFKSAYLAFLTGSVFLNMQDSKYLWLLFAVPVVLEQIAVSKQEV